MKNRERILILLGYSPQGYNQMIELAGYKWLDRNFTADSKLKNIYVTSKRFWQWWNKQWDLRDNDYLNETSLRYIDEPLTGEELQIALGFFVEKHIISSLEIFPNKWVREEVYSLMKAADEKVKALTQKK